MDDNCLFCKIIKGDIPCHKVYEDDHTFAFLDIRPISDGHTLVVPKDHFENIYSLPDETMARLSLTVKKIAVAIKQAMDTDGVNIIMNNESHAGQAIFHAHFHIVPRDKSDGLIPWPQKEYQDGEAKTIAEQIKNSI